MRWISALTRTIAVTNGYRPGTLLGWRLRYYGLWPAAELTKGPHALGGQPGDQRPENFGGGACVGESPVVRHGTGAEETGQRAQLAVRHLLRVQQLPGERHRVEHRESRPGQPAGLRGGAEKADVERGVVRDQHAAVGEPEQPGQDGRDLRGGGQQPIGDAGELFDGRRDRDARVDQRGELAAPYSAADPHHADLGDRAVVRRP